MTEYHVHLEPATFRPTGRLSASQELVAVARKHWLKILIGAVLLAVVQRMIGAASNPDIAS